MILLDRTEGVKGHDPAWGHNEGHLCNMWILHEAIVPWAVSRQDFTLQPPPLPLWSVGLSCCDWASLTDTPWWESRLKARLCDCRTRPGMTQAQWNREHCGLPWPRPWGPWAPPVPWSTSCLCHSTSKSNPWSKAKEKKGYEKREETEKWKGRGRLTCVLRGGRERTTNHSLSDRRGSCSGRGTCVPAASLADAKLRPSARQCQTHEKFPWQHPRASVWNKQPFNLI